jgi:hypothetical protein
MDDSSFFQGKLFTLKALTPSNQIVALQAQIEPVNNIGK